MQYETYARLNSLVYHGSVPDFDAGAATYPGTAIDTPYDDDKAAGINDAFFSPLSTPYRFGPDDPSILSDSWIDVTPLQQAPGRALAAAAPKLYYELVPTVKSSNGQSSSKAKTLSVPDKHRAVHECFPGRGHGIRCTCGRPFTGKAAEKNWRRHVEDYLYPIRYACPQCQFRCARRNGLVQHSVRQHGNKPFSCRFPGCYRVFANQKALNHHMETAHQS